MREGVLRIVVLVVLVGLLGGWIAVAAVGWAMDTWKTESVQ